LKAQDQDGCYPQSCMIRMRPAHVESRKKPAECPAAPQIPRQSLGHNDVWPGLFFLSAFPVRGWYNRTGLDMFCFHCKRDISIASLGASGKVGFRDNCPACSSDLHACLNCDFYDEGAFHECRESSAEWVKRKDAANVCEYFRPRASSKPSPGSKEQNLSALDELFKK